MLISCSNGVQGDRAIVGKLVYKRGHMFGCSRIIEFDLDFWQWSLWPDTVCDLLNGLISIILIDLLNGSLNFVNFFDGSPCFSVHIGQVGVVIALIIALIAIPIVVTVVVIAIAIAVVSIAVIPRQALAFFATSFGPAFRLVVPLLVAVVTFNI